LRTKHSGGLSVKKALLKDSAGDWFYLYRAGHRFFKERPDESS
jgi:hypothetical protein